MSEVVELKECPFCGMHLKRGEHQAWHPAHEDCPARLTIFGWDEPAKIRAWQRRAYEEK